MIENFTVFFIIMALGVLFKRLKPAGIDADGARHVINTVVINFFLPALCLKVMSSAVIDKNTLLFPLAAVLTILISLALAFLCYSVFEKFIHFTKKEKGILILAASFGNVTFLGLPVLTGLYGEEAAKYVLIYDFLATTPLLWIVGASIASYYGTEQKLTIKEGLKTLAALPPIWALVLALILNIAGIKLPALIIKTCELMSAPVIPLMIFSVGMALAVPKIKHTVITAPAVIIKLCAAPLIAFAAAAVLGIDGLAFKASVMEAAMPTMVLTLVIASRYKLDHALCAFAILLSTAASFFTIPFIASLIK